MVRQGIVIFAAALTAPGMASASSKPIPVIMEAEICPKSVGDLDYFLTVVAEKAGASKYTRDVFYIDQSEGKFDGLFYSPVLIMRFERFPLSTGRTVLRMKMYRARSVAASLDESEASVPNEKTIQQLKDNFAGADEAFRQQFPCEG